MAASDKFQYLQQVKLYNCLIKSLQSSSRNAVATFGAGSDQAKFCEDMLQETMKEARLIEVVIPSTEDEATDIDNGTAQSNNHTPDQVSVALNELKERMAGVKIG